jgi:hypothetical protein
VVFIHGGTKKAAGFGLSPFLLQGTVCRPAMSKKKPLPPDDADDDLVKQIKQDMEPGPALPPDSPAAALAAIDEWNEQWLAIRDPDEPGPPKPLAVAAELDHLIERTNYLARWCETSGLDSTPLIQFAHDAQQTYFGLRSDLPSVPAGFWVLLDRLHFKLQPLQPPTVSGKSAPTVAKREPISDDEAKALVKQFLKKNPTATVREVAAAVGIAVGRIPDMKEWREAYARRKAAKPVKPKKARELTKQMEQTIGKEADPATRIMVDDAIWQRLIEQADQQGRAKLHAMTATERADLIRLTREDLEEQGEQDRLARKHRRQEDDDCS